MGGSIGRKALGKCVRFPIDRFREEIGWKFIKIEANVIGVFVVGGSRGDFLFEEILERIVYLEHHYL